MLDNMCARKCHVQTGIYIMLSLRGLLNIHYIREIGEVLLLWALRVGYIFIFKEYL